MREMLWLVSTVLSEVSKAQTWTRFTWYWDSRQQVIAAPDLTARQEWRHVDSMWKFARASGCTILSRTRKYLKMAGRRKTDRIALSLTRSSESNFAIFDFLFFFCRQMLLQVCLICVFQSSVALDDGFCLMARAFWHSNQLGGMLSTLK